MGVGKVLGRARKHKSWAKTSQLETTENVFVSVSRLFQAFTNSSSWVQKFIRDSSEVNFVIEKLKREVSSGVKHFANWIHNNHLDNEVEFSQILLQLCSKNFIKLTSISFASKSRREEQARNWNRRLWKKKLKLNFIGFNQTNAKVHKTAVTTLSVPLSLTRFIVIANRKVIMKSYAFVSWHCSADWRNGMRMWFNSIKRGIYDTFLHRLHP